MSVSKIRIIKSAKVEVKLEESKQVEVKEVKEAKHIEEVKEGDTVDKYIAGFNDLEKIAYEIAKTRLKTSFDIEKSIGYIKR